MSTVLIIGNGFDLDLGLRTSYRNFYDSEFFPGDEGNLVMLEHAIDSQDTFSPSFDSVSVFDYLKAYDDLYNWCDIEKVLGKLINFVDFESGTGFFITKESFDRLHQAFSNYLRSVLDDNYQNINCKSAAYKLAKTLSYRDDLVIFNYNYTDSLEHIDNNFRNMVNYVHGSLIDDSIIFGVEDRLKVPRYYDFLLKSFSPFYKSHKVRYELKDADHVIFFGHSLAKADYHYFEHLFQDLTNDDKFFANRKITIFTYEDRSRRDLLWQIRTMNHNRTDVLFGNCDFRIFMTNSEREEIISFLEELLPDGVDKTFLYK